MKLDPKIAVCYLLAALLVIVAMRFFFLDRMTGGAILMAIFANFVPSAAVRTMALPPPAPPAPPALPGPTPLQVPAEAVTKPSLSPPGMPLLALHLGILLTCVLFSCALLLASCTPGEVKAANDTVIPLSEAQELNECIKKGQAAGHRKVYCDCAQGVEDRYGVPRRDGGTKACPEGNANDGGVP